MSDRSFGNDIGNTATMDQADRSDVSIVKSTATDQMETIENGQVNSRLPKPLAIEVYTKIHNSTLSKDCLLDELDDVVDEIYYAGEKVLSGGKEFEVVSSEKRGGLTTYTMKDGSKIGHRDLRRRKGLSVEEIKQIAFEDAEFDGKQWKVKEEMLKGIPIRVKEKYAPIFAKSRKSGQLPPPPTSSDSESEDVKKKKEDSDDDDDDDEEKERNGEGTSSGPTMSRRSRASGAPAMRKAMEKQLMKEQKEKEKAEKKEKEKEEKKKKKEEEKAKKLREKEEKLLKSTNKKKNGGTMDAFVKKKSGSPETSSTAAIFSPSKWGERRVAAGVKKLEEAWKKRDQESFNEACQWCEKNLSGSQQKTIENPIFRFAVEKIADKTKDKMQLKNLKGDKKAEYKAEMAEKRKEHYKQFEPKIKAWFNDDSIRDDLVLTSEPLDLLDLDAVHVDVDEEVLKCVEVTQFFVSMRKILLWTENVTGEQLRRDLHAGFGGFQRSTYKMIANLLETALQEKEHEKTAHCNARLSEFPITEHTITELVRAFFIGKTEMSVKTTKKAMAAMAAARHAEGHAEGDEMESEEKETELGGAPEEPDDEESGQEEEEEEEERARQRTLGLFHDSTHIYEWPASKQLEIVCAMKEVVHGLPIIREWFLKDATTDQSVALKQKLKSIEAKIEDQNKILSELPPEVELTDGMTRQETRDADKANRRRHAVEKRVDELRDELEQSRRAAARERDDLERIFRVTSIGTDRHLRKYYWFAYSSDAGIWIQDFGTTKYEKWVRECSEKGITDVETPCDTMPPFEDGPLSCTSSEETWYRLCSEESIRSLEASLRKDGRRERVLKKYLHTNMNEIVASVKRSAPRGGSTTNGNGSRSRTVTPFEDSDAVAGHAQNGDETETSGGASEHARSSQESAENGSEGSSSSSSQKAIPGAAAPLMIDAKTKFTGPMGPLKTVMSEMLVDWQQSGITRIGDVPLFETRMDDAHTLDEMKRLVLELVNSVPTEVLIEKFPQQVAIAKKCFSHLKMDRFVMRVEEATNSSCLHMLLAYFDARIDSRRTLPQLPCLVCHKKTGTERKVMCKQCTNVYHHTCHRPAISRHQFEEDGFKEAWWCGRCKKEERRRVLNEQRAASEQRRREAEANGDGSGSDEDREEEDEHEEMAAERDDESMDVDEDEDNPRSRNAKRKANVAMRDVLEFEGVLRKEQAPPPPKRPKKDVLPEVRELFESIEKANPRLYKVLQQVPSQSRSLRNSHHETRSLPDIEEDLDIYISAEQLREHLSTFFQQARGYIETHNSRKLDEFDSLISELNFI